MQVSAEKCGWSVHLLLNNSFLTLFPKLEKVMYLLFLTRKVFVQKCQIKYRTSSLLINFYVSKRYVTNMKFKCNWSLVFLFVTSTTYLLLMVIPYLQTMKFCGVLKHFLCFELQLPLHLFVLMNSLLKITLKIYYLF